MKTIYSIPDEVENANSIQEAQMIQKWAVTSQSESKTRAMMNMTANHPELLTSASAFDKDKMKLNCLNGVVDLTTGKLLERDPNDLHTKLVNVKFDPDAKCPVFIKFLAQVTCHDHYLFEWLQRALGYALTGSVQEQVLFICYGVGANGKSTLLETISKILGDYSTNVDFELFLTNQKSDVRIMEAVGEMKGTRLALASEVDSAKRFNESLVKRLTGGDTLRGTRLHTGAFQFEPNHKLFFLTNHLPFARDGSHGLWRRIKIIPFNAKFEGEALDSTLPDKLWAEREGILAWLVRGTKEWVDTLNRNGGTTGLGPCEAVDTAVQQYRLDNDHTTSFIDECLVLEEGVGSVGARQLYHAYQSWWRDNHDDEIPKEAIFSRRMEERGLKKRRTKAGVVYDNVTIVVSDKYEPSYNL
jgi:putative DNA primase/helicase